MASSPVTVKNTIAGDACFKAAGKKGNYERLNLIHQKVTELIKLYQPTEFAIEAPFFGKNVQSMLKLGRAHRALQLRLPCTITCQ